MRRLSLVLALALLLPVAASAAGRRSIFGAGGELFTVHAGTYATLFPHGADAVATSPVLALEIGRPAAAPQLLLVPGTEGSELEEAPSVVFEEAGRSVFVLWQSRALSGRAELDLVRWTPAAGWSEVIEISGDPMTLKGMPQVVVTRRAVHTADGPARSLTVLNLVWSEPESFDGHVLWAPVILEDGVYLGWNPVVALDDFVVPGPPSSGPSIDAVVVDSGGEASGAVAAFAANGLLTTVEMRVLPPELSRLVDQVAAKVAASGAVGLHALAGDIRAHLVGGGDLVHPALADFLGQLAHQRIVAAAGTALAGDRAALAADIRAHLVGGGAGVIFGLDANDRSPQQLDVVEVAATAASGLPTHLVAVRRVTSRPLPELGPGPYSLFVSADAGRAIVSWSDGGKLRYRETTASGWSEVLAPEVAVGEQSEDLLRARLRE